MSSLFPSKPPWDVLLRSKAHVTKNDPTFILKGRSLPTSRALNELSKLCNQTVSVYKVSLLDNCGSAM